MKRLNVFIICMLLLCAFVAGCASTPSIFTVRLQDLERQHYYEMRNEFLTNEVPAVVISGEFGRVVSVGLRHTGATEFIRMQPFYIKQGELKWVYWKDLEPGSYEALFLVNDQTNGMTSFTIQPCSTKER